VNDVIRPASGSMPKFVEQSIEVWIGISIQFDVIVCVGAFTKTIYNSLLLASNELL
jgi:hypothetical protein